MGQAYSWHPGARPLNARWALPVSLFPDESFSGWLVRAALTQGCDPLVLTGELWPKWRVWTMDCDRGIPEDRLAVLERACGVPAETFRSSMLPVLMMNVAGRIPAMHEHWLWVRPFGRRNRRCVQGWQYCPKCLDEDGRKPFLRLHWRLAWHVACHKHGTWLLDHCPHCGGPVLPHRLGAENKTLAWCALCGGDLRAACTENAGRELLTMQNLCDAAARTGRARWGGEDVSAHDWFDLARFFVGWVRRYDLPARRAFVDQLVPDVGAIKRPDLTLNIEMQPLQVRANLIAPAIRLASVGVGEMIDAALVAGMGVSAFHMRSRLPTLLMPVVAALPMRRQAKKRVGKSSGAPRSRAAVERMWRRLQRKAGLA